MLAIIFSLSMDYEVFLLSRIRERYDVTGDNTAAVARWPAAHGGIITSLALLLVIVVGAFSASGITFIKLMGVGMIICPGGGRHDHPRAARAGHHAAAGAGDLVGAAAAAPVLRALRDPGGLRPARATPEADGRHRCAAPV